MKFYILISLEGGLLNTVEVFRDERVAKAEFKRQMQENEPDWPDEEPCVYLEEIELQLGGGE